MKKAIYCDNYYRHCCCRHPHIFCCAQPAQSGSKNLSQVPEANPAYEVLRPRHGFKQKKT